MYHRILVPTDGSESMRGVVAHAIELATVHGAEIHGLYVVDTGRYATLPVETTWDGVTEMLREEGEQSLESIERMAAGADISVETAIVEGGPSNEIVEYAREHDCDTIVMGTHGRGGIDRLLLGSVAERVVRTSPVPVVTMPVSDVPLEPPEGEPQTRLPN
ncbi:universal stress protein [Haloarcula marina]|uniref:universal stress protein n=1 Tax=Haloarcula marina TaxID=2961574 RepID=UPI0020B7A289|nr:universal stress protein [Halomicroarcula marina]